ncbi:MAG: adenylyl-sulfate kinase [Bacteroidales bacterium]
MSSNKISAAQYLSRHEKEELIKQRGIVVWMTGLSGSGKTTVAVALERCLHDKNIHTKVFDGDIIRKGLNKDLGFSEAGRHENIRRIAEVSKYFVDSGIVVICGLISPLEKSRGMARDIIGEENFIEVFIDCPLDICEKRDPKGLYKRARAGKIPDFTGIDSPYEKPQNSDIIIDTESLSVEQAVSKIVEYLLPRIKV